MQLNPQLIQMLAGRLFRTPGINPNEPQPGMQGAMPQTTDPAQPQQPRWMQGLNSPLGQIGLRMLAGSRDPQGNPVGLGPAAGGAVLGYQQGEQDKVHQDLQRQYMQAQIKSMGMPDPRAEPSQLALLRAMQADPSLMETYRQMNPGGGAPASLQEWEAFQKMNPQQQAQYLNMKRQPAAPQLAEIAGVQSLVDRIGKTVTPLSTLPAETAARSELAQSQAAGTEMGKARGEAVTDLPRVQANAEQAVAAIDGLLKAPGASDIFGITGLIPIIPGTERADAKAYLDQIKGKTFLEAYNTLKGGGQITEVEGAKAEAAIARLDNAQSWAAAQEALKELKGVINAGVERARMKAGVTGAPSVGDVVDGYRFKGGDPADPNSWERQ